MKEAGINFDLCACFSHAEGRGEKEGERRKEGEERDHLSRVELRVHIALRRGTRSSVSASAAASRENPNPGTENRVGSESRDRGRPEIHRN